MTAYGSNLHAVAAKTAPATIVTVEGNQADPEGIKPQADRVTFRVPPPTGVYSSPAEVVIKTVAGATAVLPGALTIVDETPELTGVDPPVVEPEQPFTVFGSKLFDLAQLDESSGAPKKDATGPTVTLGRRPRHPRPSSPSPARTPPPQPIATIERRSPLRRRPHQAATPSGCSVGDELPHQPTPSRWSSGPRRRQRTRTGRRRSRSSQRQPSSRSHRRLRTSPSSPSRHPSSRSHRRLRTSPSSPSRHPSSRSHRRLRTSPSSPSRHPSSRSHRRLRTSPSSPSRHPSSRSHRRLRTSPSSPSRHPSSRSHRRLRTSPSSPSRHPSSRSHRRGSRTRRSPELGTGRGPCSRGSCEGNPDRHSSMASGECRGRPGRGVP